MPGQFIKGERRRRRPHSRLWSCLGHATAPSGYLLCSRESSTAFRKGETIKRSLDAELYQFI
jgi:hypothetical protein